MQQDSLALEAVPEELKKESEVVLAAVQQKGLALEYVSFFIRVDMCNSELP